MNLLRGELKSQDPQLSTTLYLHFSTHCCANLHAATRQARVLFTTSLASQLQPPRLHLAQRSARASAPSAPTPAPAHLRQTSASQPSVAHAPCLLSASTRAATLARSRHFRAPASPWRAQWRRLRPAVTMATTLVVSGQLLHSFPKLQPRLQSARAARCRRASQHTQLVFSAAASAATLRSLGRSLARERRFSTRRCP